MLIGAVQDMPAGTPAGQRFSLRPEPGRGACAPRPGSGSVG